MKPSGKMISQMLMGVLWMFYKEKGHLRMTNEPTRVNHVVTNNPGSMISIGTREKLVSSCDHKPIFATLNYLVTKPRSFMCMVWNYKEGHW